jgi:hypothetical protein
MTKIKYIIPTATALLASALGLATAPAQAATVNYINCGSPTAASCTLPQLFSGGSITVDEDMDGKIDKTFRNWMKTGTWNPPSGLTVTGFGSAPPLSAGLTFTTTNGWSVPVGTVTSFSNSFLFDVVLGDPLNVSLTNLTLNLLNSTSNGFATLTVTANGASVTNFNGGLMPVTGISTDLLAPSPSMINVGVSGMVLVTGASGNVRSFSLTFGQGSKIPEQGTVVGLLAVGGLGLAMKRRQKDS